MIDDTWNLVTLCVWLMKWPVWFAWEMVLLCKRGETTSVKLLSQVAQRRSWQLTCAVYTDAYLLSHFVWNVPSAIEHARLKGVIGWAIVPILIAYDVVMWSTPRVDYRPFHRWARFPLLVAAAGVASGHYLFPQVGPTPWDWLNVGW